MKTSLFFSILLAFSLFACRSEPPRPDNAKVAPAPPAPEILLPRPTLEAQLAYLGIPAGREPFSLGEVKSQAVVIEIFNMYCPHCQREAPQVNKLYELIQSEDLDKKIKIIGIGGGNSDFEVEIFKKKFNIPFPLFSDPDFMNTHKLLTEVRTPCFFLLNLQDSGRGAAVVYSHPGGFETPQAFLDTVRTKINLK